MSCKNEDSTGIPSESSISISGYVSPFDENENPAPDRSGYLVFIQGTSKSITTNAAGQWSFDSTEHNPILVFGKQGFATRWLTWALNSGQNDVGEIRVGKNPNWNVTELQFFFDSTRVHIAGRVSSPAGPGRFRNVVVFMSDSRTVSSDPQHYRLYYDKAKVQGPGTIFVTPDGLNADTLGMAHGTMVYVAAYGATPYYGVDASSVPRPSLSGLSVTAFVDSFIVP